MSESNAVPSSYVPARRVTVSRRTDWVYYNEIDPYAAEWLKNLIAAGELPKGDVDTRSIKDVQADDLIGYRQCHFFAGIGGWPLALKIAGWPAGEEVWTGSCPCQPFSLAGKQEGFEDERHLWPDWFYRIDLRRPSTVFGEQVASATEWLARVRSDMEGVGYALGAIPMEAASAGACQLRDRFWFVASSDYAERRTEESGGDKYNGQAAGWDQSNGDIAECGDGLLAGDDFQCESNGRLQRSGQFGRSGSDPETSDRALASGKSQRGNGRAGMSQSPRREVIEASRAGDLASSSTRLEERKSQPGNLGSQLASTERGSSSRLVNPASLGWGEGWTESEFRSRGFTAAVASLPDGTQFIECPDGKYRRLPPPRVRWLGNGIPARVARLRAFGNAIVPHVAAEFIRAYMEVKGIKPCFE